MNSFDFQQTVAGELALKGVGLHSGSEVFLRILPSKANSGISFIRTDLRGSEPIKAEAYNISSTKLCTVLGDGECSVATVEHLMAAFALLKIDNAIVEVDGPELPILDGSAIPYIKALSRIGVKILKAPRTYYKVLRPFEVRINDQFLIVRPSTKTRVSCTIDFGTKVIGRQKASFEFDSDIEKLASARTFCHINDVHSMRQQGLARGGSLENAVVVSDTGVINEGGLRSKDEFVQHKLLDMIGDLYLLGRPILGEVVAHKPGHTLHAAFALKVLAEEGVLGVATQTPLGGAQLNLSQAFALG